MMEKLLFFDHGDPREMEPLSCCRKLGEMEMGAGSLEMTLAEFWSPLVREGFSLRAAIDFWPDAGLLRQLAELPGPFQVRDPFGIAAERCGEGSCVSFPCGPDSFRIRYPWDLLRANEEYLKQVTGSRIRGVVHPGATVQGVLLLDEGSEILPGVYIEGVARIGKNCKIGPNAYLRGFTYLGDQCHVGQAVEIKNSILMFHVAAGHLSYLGDSIVCPRTNFGAGTIISNFRHDGKNHRSMVNGVLVDTGRRKFGSIIGDNVHTGIHTSIYPGRKIWPDCSTRPGEIVQKDLMP